MAKWKPGAVETSTYRLSESGMAGVSTYTVAGERKGHRRVFRVEFLTERKLQLAGQEGKLETRGLTIVDGRTFDLVESNLTTSLNGVETGSMHAERKGREIEVTQKLRGSPAVTRVVTADGAVVEESALLFYLSRLPWQPGRQFRWVRFNAAQGRLLHASARAEGQEDHVLRVIAQSEIGPATYYIRPGRPAVVLKVLAGTTDRMELETPEH